MALATLACACLDVNVAANFSLGCREPERAKQTLLLSLVLLERIMVSGAWKALLS